MAKLTAKRLEELCDLAEWEELSFEEVQALLDMARQSIEQEELIRALQKAGVAEEAATRMECICSGFTIQYQGGCQCEKREQLRLARDQKTRAVNDLIAWTGER